MKVFVTGGAGYIGSICVEQLLNSGHEVVVFDNLSEGHQKAVDKRARFIEGCLSDRETIINSVVSNQSQIIMHFAANALVGESMVNPSKYFRNNVSNGINLLDAAIEGKIEKFVFSSTCATYGMPETVPMSENLPLNPINPYGESKVIFEKLDLADLKSVRDLFEKHADIQGIIHFAALKSVGESVHNPIRYYNNNIISLLNLLSESKNPHGSIISSFAPRHEHVLIIAAVF